MADLKRLKEALIENLTDQVENGSKVLTKEGEVEIVSAPASVLAVAAKVVKDFHSEIPSESLTSLSDAVKNYQLRKAETTNTKASH